jgi:hypothetical protein
MKPDSIPKVHRYDSHADQENDRSVETQASGAPIGFRGESAISSRRVGVKPPSLGRKNDDAINLVSANDEARSIRKRATTPPRTIGFEESNAKANSRHAIDLIYLRSVMITDIQDLRG